MLAAPRDLVAVADDRGVLDHTRGCAGEQPSYVAQPPHRLVTTVWPPTTTFVTSRPERP